MDQNLPNILEQVQKMLSKLSSHIFHVNSILKEINKVINQYRHLNIPVLNQMNNLNSMINSNKVNFNQSLNPNFNIIRKSQNNFNTIRKSQALQNFEMNIPFNMVNITDINNKLLNDTLILYLDKETTVNEMLIEFLKKIGREDCIIERLLDLWEMDKNLILGIKEKLRNYLGMLLWLILL